MKGRLVENENAAYGGNERIKEIRITQNRLLLLIAFFVVSGVACGTMNMLIPGARGYDAFGLILMVPAAITLAFVGILEVESIGYL